MRFLVGPILRFRLPGLTQSRMARPGRTWYQDMRRQVLYKSLFRSKSLSLTRKILFAKKRFFQNPQKRVFRVLRTRNARAQLLSIFPECALGQCIILQNFSPIRAVLPEILVFEGEKVLVLLMYK